MPVDLATDLADRRRLELVAPGQRDPDRLTEGGDVLVLDEADLVGLDDHGRFLLRREIEDRGFTLEVRAGDLDVFIRRRD